MLYLHSVLDKMRMKDLSDDRYVMLMLSRCFFGQLPSVLADSNSVHRAGV